MIDMAVVEDVKEISDLLWDAANTDMKFYIDGDYDHGSKMIRVFIESDNGVVLVAREQETIVGVLIGFVTTHWYKDEMYGNTICLYVDKEHRNRRYGLELIDMFERYCAEVGCAETIIGVTASDYANTFRRLLGRKGYEVQHMGYHKQCHR